MSRRGNTKADLILKGARGRVTLAQEAVDDAKRQLALASATLWAYEDTLKQLENELASTPRKVKDPKSPAPVAEKKSGRRSAKDQSTQSSEGDKGSVSDASKCAICGSEPLFRDHDPESPNYHIFRASLKKKDKGNGEIKLPDNPDDFHAGATA